MRKMYQDVLAFHKQLGFEIGDPLSPRVIDGEKRNALLLEEARETLDALEAKDPVELIDGLMDVLYVAIGNCIAFGIAEGVQWEHNPFPSPAALSSFEQEHVAERLSKLCDHVVTSIKVSEARGGRFKIDDVRYATMSLITFVNVVVCELWKLDSRPFWAAVHETNMAKRRNPAPGGKALKPEGWSAPDMWTILKKQYDDAHATGLVKVTR